MSWVYEHCQNLHVTRIHTYHLFPTRKGNLYEQPASGTAVHHCKMGLPVCWTCRQPTDARLGSTTGSLHPTVRAQVTQTGQPHDGALVTELHLNCLRPACDSSHLPINWDFNIFLICPLIYMPLMSHFHGASFLFSPGLSVPCAWNVTHRIATPQPCLITLLWDALTSQIWYRAHSMKTREKGTSKRHFCFRTVLLEGMFPPTPVQAFHPSPGLPAVVWLEVYSV